MDIPPLLRPYGERGVSMFRIARQVDTASAHRPLALATGSPGDVYLCHPFLVHAPSLLTAGSRGQMPIRIRVHPPLLSSSFPSATCAERSSQSRITRDFAEVPPSKLAEMIALTQKYGEGEGTP